MLRITAHDNPQGVTFRVEGRLVGPWAAVLDKCWRKNLRNAMSHKFVVDLNGVTCIDAAGKAVIAAMFNHGAEFVAEDCMTKAIVEEITGVKSSST